MKPFIALTIVLVLESFSDATEQARDRLIVNGRTFAIEQQPMLGFWHSEDWQSDGDKPMPDFDVVSSSNWRGYVATFSIDNDKLYLLKIEAEADRKPTTGRELVGKRLPAVARWFTGSIFMAVGDYDQDAKASRYVIEFLIEKGMVTDSRFHASLTIPYTWNGRPFARPRSRTGGEPSDAPKDRASRFDHGKPTAGPR